MHTGMRVIVVLLQSNFIYKHGDKIWTEGYGLMTFDLNDLKDTRVAYLKGNMWNTVKHYCHKYYLYFE